MEFDRLTLALAAATGALTLLLGRKKPFVPLAALMLAVPFRDFSTRWMNVHTKLTVAQVTAIGRWWFALIAALLGLCAVRWVRDRRAARRWPRPALVDALLSAALLAAAIATLTSPEPAAAFTSFRGYVQPLAVFLLTRSIRPSRRELRALVVLWLAVGAVMALFALVQVVGWDEARYRDEGYLRQDGSLVVPYTRIGERRYLRPASTVSGPNELGMDMALLVLVSLFAVAGERGANRGLPTGLALLFVVGLAVTVSRSSLLGFLAGLFAWAALHWRRLRRRVGEWSRATRTRAILIGAAGLAAVVLVLALTGMTRVVVGTLDNLAGEYHILDTTQAVEYLIQHPQGVGMGLVEPKGAVALIEAGGAYHVEGSIFQIAMEMGVWGLAIWLAFWATALERIWRNWHAVKANEIRIVTGTAFAGWLGSLVAFLFLPLMQSISLMVWLWFLLGVAYESDRLQTGWDRSGIRPARRPAPHPRLLNQRPWAEEQALKS